MPKMIKTTPRKCKQCKYRGNTYSMGVTCDYYLMTGERRGCEVGECNKYEKRKPGDPDRSTYRDFQYGFGIGPEDYKTWWWGAC